MRLAVDLGIMGGIGPLVSSQFVFDFYQSCGGRVVEQQMPSILALHQPEFPDRTEAINQGRQYELYQVLTERLDMLLKFGCNKILVPCFTLHTVFNLLPSAQLEKLCNLLAIVDRMLQPDKQYLLLCTNGTRQEQLFGDVDKANGSKLVYPNSSDQALVHDLIYQLKIGVPITNVWPRFEQLFTSYQVNGVIAGCTEIYLLWPFLAKYCAQRQWHHVDALCDVRQRITQNIHK